MITDDRAHAKALFNEPSVGALETNRPSTAEAPRQPLSLRALRVQEFLQARSHQPKNRQAYQRDLDLFMAWMDTALNQVTRRQVAQCK